MFVNNLCHLCVSFCENTRQNPQCLSMHQFWTYLLEEQSAATVTGSLHAVPKCTVLRHLTKNFCTNRRRTIKCLRDIKSQLDEAFFLIYAYDQIVVNKAERKKYESYFLRTKVINE